MIFEIFVHNVNENRSGRELESALSRGVDIGVDTEVKCLSRQDCESTAHFYLASSNQRTTVTTGRRRQAPCQEVEHELMQEERRTQSRRKGKAKTKRNSTSGWSGEAYMLVLS